MNDLLTANKESSEQQTQIAKLVQENSTLKKRIEALESDNDALHDKCKTTVEYDKTHRNLLAFTASIKATVDQYGDSL